MTSKDISFIIPVFNRPDEVKELLESFKNLNGNKDFEVVIVEDGSTISSEEVVDEYKEHLNLSYFFKFNTGPGDSRNYGMQRARGEFFIILDSDCILPPQYLTKALNSLNQHYVDCFGGPDAAHASFSNLQKAINFAMTSFVTTGGIRGNKKSVDRFQPRSFNMGISKIAFEATQGFGRIHPGEDPDLSIRLTKLGFKTKLIPEAYVFHKRRISWKKFYQQVHKFGLVRPILNTWHPETKKITYWFPSLFCMGLIVAILSFIFGYALPLIGYGCYFFLCFVLAWLDSKSIEVAIFAIIAVIIQFFGYGYGFIKSTFKLGFSDKNAEQLFPKLFFS